MHGNHSHSLTQSFTGILIIALAVLFMACGDANSDRIIVLPEANPTDLTALDAPALTLETLDRKRSDEATVFYKVELRELKTQPEESSTPAYAGVLLKKDIQNANGFQPIEEFTMQRLVSAKATNKIYFKSSGIDPLFQMTVTPEENICRFSWQSVYDTSPDKSKLFFDEVVFEGPCELNLKL